MTSTVSKRRSVTSINAPNKTGTINHHQLNQTNGNHAQTHHTAPHNNTDDTETNTDSPLKPNHSNPFELASSQPSPRSLLQSSVELILCTLSIYACFIGYAILQERIYSTHYGPQQEKFTHSLFLVWCQCIGNAAFALLLMLTIQRSNRPHAVRHRDYMSISFSYIGAMFTSNLALSYMSYPAQALAKSCKIIPVMLMRMLVLGKRYSVVEYVQVVCVTCGIGVFMMFDGADRRAHAVDAAHWSQWWLGIALCLCSLVLDGFTGPTQERINQQHKPTMSQMMFYMNAYAIALVAVALIATGQLWSGIEFCRHYPGFVASASMFSLLSAVGQACILFTLRRFNSLILVTITTTRKFFTILASVLMFGHHLALTQWGGVALVFIGLGVEIVEKAQRKQRQQQQHGKQS